MGVATSGEMRAVLAAVAAKGQVFAESIAPVDTGEYRSSFEVATITRGEGSKKRAVSQLVNTADHAAAVEWGNSNSPKRRILGQTLDHLAGP